MTKRFVNIMKQKRKITR